MFKQLLLISLIRFVFSGNHYLCGYKGANITKLIVNGEPTQPLEFPWQVLLKYQGNFLCGGSILNEDWILTAAHCVDWESHDTYSVVLGEHNRWTDEGTELTREIVKVISHPGGFSNDIAIIKMDRSIDFFGDAIHLWPICLPNKEGLDDKVGTECISTGWGITEDGKLSDVLRKVKVNIISQSSCAYDYPDRITDGMICTYADWKGTCQGDSGGPVNCNLNGLWWVYGTTSWGKGCAEGYADVNARVSEVSDWIWQQIDSN